MIVATPSDREILYTRTFHAPRRLVFEAWTRPEHIRSWMLGPEGWSMPVCECDARTGGKWRYVWRKDGGTEMEMSGVFKEVTPPERIVHTERWGPGWPETLNTIEFVETDGVTTVTLQTLYPTKQDRDAAMNTGASTGLETSYKRLDDVLGRLAVR
jgi:uncharacterized protein YndB with AHSA1/START domain